MSVAVLSPQQLAGIESYPSSSPKYTSLTTRIKSVDMHRQLHTTHTCQQTRRDPLLVTPNVVQQKKAMSISFFEHCIILSGEQYHLIYSGKRMCYTSGFSIVWPSGHSIRMVPLPPGLQTHITQTYLPQHGTTSCQYTWPPYQIHKLWQQAQCPNHSRECWHMPSLQYQWYRNV